MIAISRQAPWGHRPTTQSELLGARAEPAFEAVELVPPN
jgi:hypothetical protein